MTADPTTAHIAMKSQNSMDRDSPESTWPTPNRKAANMTEQTANLRTGGDPEGGDLPSLSEPFAIVDELGNPISAGAGDEDLTHG
ncbi:MAG: hypothetical protein QHD01_26290 [Bradyrhizobium sp.]|uniref:hypothetical protein n=1 Tax=Bradyrhizobium sp. TaxID=376 RepID=UPI0029A8D1BD|nr:hypothetical protein [Bradyrhizobium sp.]MDX3970089.1 hypothetical protein [Bradyrhizobium sp.]